MTTTPLFRNIDGQDVKVSVGDWVGFKADIEQSGRVAGFRVDRYRGVILTLENEGGFSGEYIGGQTRTEVDGRDCWTD